MRWLFLVLGIALGFGLAHALREELAAPSATLTGPEIGPSASIPEDEYVREWDETEKGPWGRVVVDFRGVEFEPTVHLLGRSPFGTPVEDGGSLYLYREEGSRDVRIDIRAGRYLAWWRNGTAERVGVRVRVEIGRETRLDHAQGTLLPLQDGLGQLDVHIIGLDNGPLSGVGVHLKGGGIDEEDEGYQATTATGRCRFEIMPGEYFLVIGRARFDASVRAGQTTLITVRHDGEGDLEIARTPSWISFELVAESGARISPNGGPGLFRFIDPGTYKLVGSVHKSWHTGFKRDFESVEIRPNERTRIDCPFPTGALSVQLESDGTSANTSVLVAVRREGDASSKTSKVLFGEVYEGKTSWGTHWLAMKPGKYFVTVTGAEWATEKTVVAVADGFSEVVLQMTRK